MQQIKVSLSASARISLSIQSSQITALHNFPHPFLRMTNQKLFVLPFLQWRDQIRIELVADTGRRWNRKSNGSAASQTGSGTSRPSPPALYGDKWSAAYSTARADTRQRQYNRINAAQQPVTITHGRSRPGYRVISTLCTAHRDFLFASVPLLFGVS